VAQVPAEVTVAEYLKDDNDEDPRSARPPRSHLEASQGVTLVKHLESPGRFARPATST
jgi:hypothetical protein